MDPKPRSGFLAAPASASGSLRLPGKREGEFPRLDDHLVQPEVTRDEMVRGRRVVALPANPPHADRHSDLDYVIRGHAAKGTVVSTDMITRLDEGSDFATDTSVRKEGIDPRTSERYLEELAFEVVSSQSMRDIRERAEDLTKRGVRRLFAIFVKTNEVREWSTASGGWITLPPDAVIEDPMLARPLEVRALLDGAAADDAVVEALASKGNPRLAQREAAEHERGLERGRIEAIETACELLGIPLGPREHARLSELDAAALARLLARIKLERRWPSD
ncbi:hypothetical protein ACNOYE_13305 [Nannocystaceae bacterium ST9]